MPEERPCVLSIAGFDPSAGAGVLADIKTFEQHKVLGMAVASCLTFQNDAEFDGIKWIETNEIVEQITVLSRKFKFGFVKIGMIKDLDTLNLLTSHLHVPNSQLKIIWDPILKASAGFEIHKSIDKKKVIDFCKKIFLITPNTDEIKSLTGESDEMKGAKELSGYCNVFLKGGHRKEKQGKDYLFTPDDKIFPFRPKKISEYSKHGSGCVLSSAIMANLANGNTLQRSCLKAKDYVTKFLNSNKTLLGYHKI